MIFNQCSIDCLDTCQIDAGKLMEDSLRQSAAHSGAWSVRLPGSWRGSVIESSEVLFDGLIALFDLEAVVQIHGLPERKQMLLSPCALKRLGDCRSFLHLPWRIAASFWGSRSPARIDLMILIPVVPVTSVITLLSLMFICSALCMCWT